MATNRPKPVKSTAKRGPSKNTERVSKAASVRSSKVVKRKRSVKNIKNKKSNMPYRLLKSSTIKKYKTFKKRQAFLKSFKKILRKVNNRLTWKSLFRVLSVRLTVCLAVLAVAITAALTHNNKYTASYVVSAASLPHKVQESPGKVTTAGPAQKNGQFSTYPTWSQNFVSYRSHQLEERYWEINIGAPQNGNNEAEYYTMDTQNLRISNGALTLEATHQPEPGGYSYGSARIDTSGKVNFLYGRIDVMAELPGGVGTWPAIWLLPANTKYEDMSPASDATSFLNGGEIDMAEAVGFNPYIVYGVVHTVTANHNNPNGVGYFNQVTVPGNNVNYNLYSVLWTPTSITFEVNNMPYFTYHRQPGADYHTWPFDQPFYLIINLAVGGVWGGEDTAQFPGNGIDNSALPAQMNIKSIYYYPYIGSSAN